MTSADQLALIRANCERDEPRPTCRLLKVECPTCGYVARTTKRWLSAGAPICPTCNVSMVQK